MASSAENQVTAVTNHLCPHYPFCIPGHGRQLSKLQTISCRRFGVPLTPERILGRLVGLWSIRRHVAAPPQRHTTSQETTWHPSLPGVSLFWRFRCYLDRPPALYGLLRYPSPPGVSRFRHFRCHLGNLVCAPVRGTLTVAWNIAVRTRGVFTHRTGFQKLACAERGLVRTGWRGGEAAGGNRWRKRISAGAGVSKQGHAQMQSETGDKRRQEQAGTGQTEQEQASANGNKRRCNQRQVAGRRRERTDGAGAGEASGNRKQAGTDKREQAPFYAEHTTRRAGQTASPPNAKKPSRKVNRLPLCR